jgi:hypothetical protein
LLVADADFLAGTTAPYTRQLLQRVQQRIPGQLNWHRPFAPHHGQGQQYHLHKEPQHTRYLNPHRQIIFRLQVSEFACQLNLCDRMRDCSRFSHEVDAPELDPTAPDRVEPLCRGPQVKPVIGESMDRQYPRGPLDHWVWPSAIRGREDPSACGCDSAPTLAVGFLEPLANRSASWLSDMLRESEALQTPGYPRRSPMRSRRTPDQARRTLSGGVQILNICRPF